MIYIFRFFGLLIGFRLARLPGAIVGFILGGAIDFWANSRLEARKTKRREANLANAAAAQVFFHSIFVMLGKLAYVDGQPTKEELDSLDNICTKVFSLDRTKRKYARELFDSSRTSSTTFQYHAAQLQAYYQNQLTMLENMLDMIVGFALCDGPLKPSEVALLKSAVTIFGLPESNYQESLARHGASQKRTRSSEQEQSSDHYATLGCTPNDSEEQIKKRYRKLVADFHPDKIISKELPPEFIEFAHKKFRDIQHAYESVKKERGFS